ncbi:MAG: hypothetical protein K2K53_02015 [Oscillospiraceae bacterium]|nr:hypothetical protein [Oscillospiraceae bacterium]
MRRIGSCVLMMALLLCGCRSGGGETAPETAAMAVRDTYQTLAGWSSEVDVTAQVGDKVFDFTLDARWQRDGETVLTITAPELLSGITARIAQGETVLEYDGAGLSLGLLDGKGLTAVSAVPWLMEQIDRGYMAKCAWAGDNGELLRITFRDPQAAPNDGTEYQITFEKEGFALAGAEVSVDGAVVLTARFRNFTGTQQS